MSEMKFLALLVGVTGFEPATSWSQTRRSTKLSYTPCSARDLTRSRPKRIQNLGSACAATTGGMWKSVTAINLFWSERAFRTFYVYVMLARRRSNHSDEISFPYLCNHFLCSIQIPVRA